MLQTERTVSCSMAAGAGASNLSAPPGETPMDERTQQLAPMACDQQYKPQPEGLPGMPAQFPPGVDPTIPAQPLMTFDQAPPAPVPVQSKEQEMAILRGRNDGLPLSKEESDDEVHPLPDAASGFRCSLLLPHPLGLSLEMFLFLNVLGKKAWLKKSSTSFHIFGFSY